MPEFTQVIHSDPEILGGTPVFIGTRVPVQSLFDYLTGGETLDEFLHQFPSVDREQAITVLGLALATVLGDGRPTVVDDHLPSTRPSQILRTGR